jgi:carbamoyl-phosphate synthase large subunit
MGVAADFPAAFAKAQAAVGSQLPSSGTVFLTVTDSDKSAVMGLAALLHDLGFKLVATRGTAAAIKRMGIPVETINKIQEGAPNVVDWIDRGDVDLVINTPTGTAARSDGYEIRRAAVARGVPCITTIAGGMAAVRGIAAARLGDPPVLSLQELHAKGVSGEDGAPEGGLEHDYAVAAGDRARRARARS